jgi:hypothetical protein
MPEWTHSTRLTFLQLAAAPVSKYATPSKSCPVLHTQDAVWRLASKSVGNREAAAATRASPSTNNLIARPANPPFTSAVSSLVVPAARKHCLHLGSLLRVTIVHPPFSAPVPLLRDTRVTYAFQHLGNRVSRSEGDHTRQSGSYAPDIGQPVDPPVPSPALRLCRVTVAASDHASWPSFRPADKADDVERIAIAKAPLCRGADELLQPGILASTRHLVSDRHLSTDVGVPPPVDSFHNITAISLACQGCNLPNADGA